MSRKVQAASSSAGMAGTAGGDVAVTVCRPSCAREVPGGLEASALRGLPRVDWLPQVSSPERMLQDVRLPLVAT